MATKANEITFGIEIETHVASTHIVGEYHRPEQVSYLPAGWGASYDSSIDYPAGRRACEFVSPKLKGEHGLRQADHAIRTINERGARVNASCGVHVTVTFPARDTQALAKLVTMFAHFEGGLYAATGSPRRLQGIWAKGLKSHGEQVQGKVEDKAARAMQRARWDRRHGLNLTHVARGRNRVEFRLFSGSTNADKIMAWVRLVLAIVEYVLDPDTKVPTKWTAKRNHKHVSWKGAGECELYHLLNLLGWYKVKRFGYKGRTYGESAFVEGTPTVEESRKELKRLARRHDERVAQG